MSGLTSMLPLISLKLLSQCSLRVLCDLGGEKILAILTTLFLCFYLDIFCSNAFIL
jgi:hypothetical protein